jgi:hypothetical protein
MPHPCGLSIIGWQCVGQLILLCARALMVVLKRPLRENTYFSIRQNVVYTPATRMVHIHSILQ